jgi:hypothetical protein
MKARGLFALCMSAALVAGACGEADNDSVIEPMDSRRQPNRHQGQRNRRQTAVSVR